MHGPLHRMTIPSRRILPILTALLLLIIVSSPLVLTQNSDVFHQSYHTFVQLALLYKVGGTAPTIVAQMNVAIGLIELAREKRALGDVANATILENHARTIMGEVSPQILTAQQEAAQNSTARMQVDVLDAVLLVVVLTVGFYANLLILRWYEKEKLFEMKIVDEGS